MLKLQIEITYFCITFSITDVNFQSELNYFDQVKGFSKGPSLNQSELKKPISQLAALTACSKEEWVLFSLVYHDVFENFLDVN